MNGGAVYPDIGVFGPLLAKGSGRQTDSARWPGEYNEKTLGSFIVGSPGSR